ncbi:DUF2515 family protein [Halalkalibacillus halophilus]|uniref:DUF2515 family protein n=1 Tax=Halalkalibacillus halophilus TaxID=392827 RepID=UPI00040BD28C|nr:DUF2515 family protein [Halalkalibacillus halophilus]
MTLSINQMLSVTKKHNETNQSRTKAYLDFYLKHPEIKWAFLASCVSRNAGWNMSDLINPDFTTILSSEQRARLYLVYETANWYIFKDAFPQLLIYEQSKKDQILHIDMLKEFNISIFMQEEWKRFFKNGDQNRILYAQIINEQQLIEHPLIQNHFFQKAVFNKLAYNLQRIFHLNAVLLPTKNGDLYGAYVPSFENVDKRIGFGKDIAHLLFQPHLYPLFIAFSIDTPILGDRNEYLCKNNVMKLKIDKNPSAIKLRQHVIHNSNLDWFSYTKLKDRWFEEPLKQKRMKPINDSYHLKRRLFHEWSSFKRK